jgi:hypothetical protein
VTESKCKSVCPFNDENRAITIFKSIGCKPCRILVPSIVEKAKIEVFTIEVIDSYDKDTQERVRKSQVRWGSPLKIPKEGEITVN